MSCCSTGSRAADARARAGEPANDRAHAAGAARDGGGDGVRVDVIRELLLHPNIRLYHQTHAGGTTFGFSLSLSLSLTHYSSIATIRLVLVPHVSSAIAHARRTARLLPPAFECPLVTLVYTRRAAVF